MGRVGLSKFFAAWCLTLAAGLSGAAFAQQTSTDTPPATAEVSNEAPPAASDPNAKKMVCRQTSPIGSRIPKKTCKTVAEWDELRRMGSDAARTGTEQSRMIRQGEPGG